MHCHSSPDCDQVTNKVEVTNTDENQDTLTKQYTSKDEVTNRNPDTLAKQYTKSVSIATV
jgi:hypothetical protein